MNQYDPTFDLKINVGHCDFALYLEDYLMYEQLFGIMSQYDPKFDLKINVGH